MRFGSGMLAGLGIGAGVALLAGLIVSGVDSMTTPTHFVGFTDGGRAPACRVLDDRRAVVEFTVDPLDADGTSIDEIRFVSERLAWAPLAVGSGIRPGERPIDPAALVSDKRRRVDITGPRDVVAIVPIRSDQVRGISVAWVPGEARYWQDVVIAAHLAHGSCVVAATTGDS